MSEQKHPHAAKIAAYREKALEAEDHAMTAQDAYLRQMWLQIASDYTELATRLERGER